MIREIINFTNEVSRSKPEIFLLGKEPLEGLHIFVELDTESQWRNSASEYKIDYDYYDGKCELDDFLQGIMQYEDLSKRVGTSMNKALDKKKQIFSCSPFVLSFKKQSLFNDGQKEIDYEKILKLLPYYFENARTTCLDKEDESAIQLSKAFEQVCNKVLKRINTFHIPQMQKDGAIIQLSAFEIMKKDFYISIYLKNIPIDKYRQSHENYLKQKLFNTNDYNSNAGDINDDTYGVSGFLNGANSKKPFLSHKTASMYKGISGRIKAKDTVDLNNFETLLSNKSLPNPLPIIIDREEFATNIDIIKIFNESAKKLSYTQILKKVCADQNKNLSNYYLLNIQNGEVKDFDYVPLFRYKMEHSGKKCEVLNLFGAKHNKESDSNILIHTIFSFENIIVRNIFNNSLVKIKDDMMSVNYFGEIDPTYVSGGDLVYQMIMKYRMAFYDYIYKSKENAISCLMFDDIMYNVIIADLRSDEAKNGGFHSKEDEIKRKMNIWFSLYDYFDLYTQNKKSMASKIPELMDNVRKVANDSNAHLSADPAEFAFAAGQIIYYLLTKSVASNKTYAMIEPILQKSTVEQLQDAVTEMIKVYKHEIDLNKGRFANLSKDVLTYETNENMKKYQRYLLAGCFAPSIIYEKKEESLGA